MAGKSLSHPTTLSLNSSTKRTAYRSTGLSALARSISSCSVGAGLATGAAWISTPCSNMPSNSSRSVASSTLAFVIATRSLSSSTAASASSTSRDSVSDATPSFSVSFGSFSFDGSTGRSGSSVGSVESVSLSSNKRCHSMRCWWKKEVVKPPPPITSESRWRFWLALRKMFSSTVCLVISR
eukprot:Lithocolla_globosa_v1_NODE_7681_length_915_cov_3.977907.p2 type:complete len:182 gc:universal NODE_7681_length_915_cov_3.977907:85-630(+)